MCYRKSNNVIVVITVVYKMDFEVPLRLFRLRGVCAFSKCIKKSLEGLGEKGDVIWFLILMGPYDCWMLNEMTDGIGVQEWLQEEHLRDCCNKKMRSGGHLD